MNKRVLDGIGVWKSDKIARVQPQWIRAEYANWIPLALANGSFEADARRIWATVYSYNRPDISLHDAEEIRGEFFRVGLLFLWLDEASGKVWGYFTGIDKPGRLPAKSRIDKKHEPIGPTPPADALRSYIELTRSNALDSVVVGQWLANGCLGFGIGVGKGSGLGVGEPSAPSAANVYPPGNHAATGVEHEVKDEAFALFWEKWPRRQAKADARRAWRKIPIAEYVSLMDGLEKWLKSEQWTRGIIPHPATWLNDKRWQDEDIPQFSAKGGTNGNRKKLTGDDLTDANLRAAGFIQ